MEEHIRKLLDSIPERQPRSKLEPHIEVIRELRRKRRSYTEISRFFEEHLKISVAPSTLFEFVKSRAKPARKPMVQLPDAAGSRSMEVQAGIPETALVPASPPVREQPTAAPPEFKFDVHEPFAVKPKPQEK